MTTAPEQKAGSRIHPLGTSECWVLLCTYLWFIQQTHDEAKRPQVPGHVLRVAVHIFLVQCVNQSLNSQKQEQKQVTITLTLTFLY